MRLAALSVAWQVDEDKAKGWVKTKVGKLLLPCVEVAAKTMDKAECHPISCWFIRLMYLIVDNETVVECHIRRRKFRQCLCWLLRILATDEWAGWGAYKS